MTRTREELRSALDGLEHQYHAYAQAINEGGDGFNPYAQALRRLQAEYDARIEADFDLAYATRLANEDAEWTLERTRERQQAWNAWVRSQDSPIAAATLAAHCHEIGYTMELLVRHIKRHGLSPAPVAAPPR
jgi:hypothetical protein